MGKHNPLVEQMTKPFTIINGYQLLKPTGVAAFLTFLPHRRRYLYVDTVAPGGGVELPAKYLHEHGVPSFKFESIELAHCGSGLVVVICSIRQKDVNSFIRIMQRIFRYHVMSNHDEPYLKLLRELNREHVGATY